MIGQIAGEFCLMLIAPSFMLFFIGSCWSFIHFLDDIANELSCINVDEATNTNKQEMRKQFCNIVQLYSYVKQLCLEVSPQTIKPIDLYANDHYFLSYSDL